MVCKNRFVSGVTLFLLALQVQAIELSDIAKKTNMPIGVTAISRDIYWLHMTIVFICIGIGVVVFGAMFWAMFFHRKSTGRTAATFHDNKYLEWGWTAVAFLILVVMAWPATKTMLAVHDTSGSDLTIETRGYQWRWQYKYLDDNRNTQLSFFSNLSTPEGEINNLEAKGEHYLLEVDEPLVIPINKKVRFLVTSNDVLHAFWVPDFSIKTDAVPGYVNELWTIVEDPGIYRGQCAELCGQRHGFMPIVVNAVTQSEYDTWYTAQAAQQQRVKELAKQEWTPEQLYERGEEVYLKNCVACHQVNGQGVPPVFPSLVGADTMLNDKQGHIEIVYNGKAGTAMQAFGLQLSTVDIAAVIHYERHAWGNNAGDTTTPVDIVEFEQTQ